jgi:hypothetical protein
VRAVFPQACRTGDSGQHAKAGAEAAQAEEARSGELTAAKYRCAGLSGTGERAPTHHVSASKLRSAGLIHKNRI